MKIISILLFFMASSVNAQSAKPSLTWKQPLTIVETPPCKEGEKQENHSWNLDANGHFISDSPPRICRNGKWVEDIEQEIQNEADLARIEAQADAEQKRRTELWNALRTRVVTDAEMVEILANGVDIIPQVSAATITDSSGYFAYPVVASRELLLLQALYYQSKMRLDAQKVCEK